MAARDGPAAPFFLQLTLSPSEAASHKFTLPAITRPGPYLLRAFVISASVQAVANANATFNITAPDWDLDLSAPAAVKLGDTVDLVATLTPGPQVALPAQVSVYLDGSFSDGDVASERGLVGSGRHFVRAAASAAGEPVTVSFAFTPTKLGKHTLSFQVLSAADAELATGTMEIEVAASGLRSFTGGFAMVGASQEEKDLLQLPMNRTGECCTCISGTKLLPVFMEQTLHSEGVTKTFCFIPRVGRMAATRRSQLRMIP
jgi:hypothetical protein